METRSGVTDRFLLCLASVTCGLVVESLPSAPSSGTVSPAQPNSLARGNSLSSTASRTHKAQRTLNKQRSNLSQKKLGTAASRSSATALAAPVGMSAAPGEWVHVEDCSSPPRVVPVCSFRLLPRTLVLLTTENVGALCADSLRDACQVLHVTAAWRLRALSDAALPQVFPIDVSKLVSKDRPLILRLRVSNLTGFSVCSFSDAVEATFSSPGAASFG